MGLCIVMVCVVGCWVHICVHILARKRITLCISMRTCARVAVCVHGCVCVCAVRVRAGAAAV